MSNKTASPVADPFAPEAGMPSTPSWLWTVVGVIVLVALAGGGVAGFEYGRQYERENGTGSCTYQNTYWLLGALLADREIGWWQSPINP